MGISSQELDSHQTASREKHGLNVPLLADESCAVAKLYERRAVVGTKRAVIIIDEDGIVRLRHDHRSGSTSSPSTTFVRRSAGLPARA